MSTVRLPAHVTSAGRGGVGDSPPRPDGPLKVKGEFAFSSDLWLAGMLWGATLRSPHARARINRIDTSAAAAMAGVHAVLTHADVPGEKYYGLDQRDQPVLAVDQVRHHGEPVVIVAADHPEIARRAVAAVEIDWEVLPPITDPVAVVDDPVGNQVQPLGGIVRHQPVRTGDVDAARGRAEVVVTREFEIGIQDQAFLGPESGLVVPADDGGLEFFVATQWIHVDVTQIAPCLGLPEAAIRMTMAGVGGAFGGREDLSMQIHAGMLALRTGRPVKMVYDRQESFFGHVHRHPARMRYTYGATRAGQLVFAEVRIVLDGGAYTSSTVNVVANAASLAVGPYVFPNLRIDAYGVYTNNPPCGAMRGFGAVQACFASESMLDELAGELGTDPVRLRQLNAVSQGSALATGQILHAPTPVAPMLDRIRTLPLPKPLDRSDIRHLPGGVAQTTHGEGVYRGIGYAVGLKNICFSEGFDDYSTARVRLEVIAGEPVALVHTAAAEVGQGLVTIAGQIVRTELGIEQVTIAPADNRVGNAGSTSASRQTYMTGGAVRAACLAVRDEVLEIAAAQGYPATAMAGGKVVSDTGEVLAALADVLGDRVAEQTREYRHRPTTKLDPLTGQGDSHVQLAICVHRAVVDVDVELGLVKVVALDAVQDVGRVMNRQALEGQIHGGAVQGLGLAVMEEIQVSDGIVRNPSFTDYLIPTVLDTPPQLLDILENPDPRAPYGLRGAGEPPTLSATPAVVAAIRDACRAAGGNGRITRVPVRPNDILAAAGGAWHA
ncbi:molybdopterin cofactor-binding domain-containing protein [Nocardia stercoris]|uniref:Xanthine dehydrogenase subunit D n=1 Tax=Nocardia stercoris TaxID=2483361 RepID=A0A3M2L116_9NOCA|nr:molybdopterin cofactor-binding domain-containing protein [Nocardia stercoris]RMI29495.1 xanthine dehydrogenase subunit D [Nocardia stercoris]